MTSASTEVREPIGREAGTAERRVWGRPLGARLRSAFGPVLAGVVIDGVDFLTFGPVGLVAGLLVGGVAGFWLARQLGLRPLQALSAGLASGIYCMFPPTTFLPVATLLGALARFVRDDDPPPGLSP